MGRSRVRIHCADKFEAKQKQVGELLPQGSRTDGSASAQHMRAVPVDEISAERLRQRNR